MRLRQEIAKGGKAGDVFLPDALMPKLECFWSYKLRSGESIEAESPLFCNQSRTRKGAAVLGARALDLEQGSFSPAGAPVSRNGLHVGQYAQYVAAQHLADFLIRVSAANELHSDVGEIADVLQVGVPSKSEPRPTWSTPATCTAWSMWSTINASGVSGWRGCTNQCEPVTSVLGR